MRFTALLLIPALVIQIVSAAEPAKLPQLFQSISDLASAAPPEFTADALLRMVESGKLADRKARRELLEHAFQLAVSAKFAMRMQAVRGATTDTESGSLSQAYALELDVLSLQSRAVRDLVPLDSAKARDLFAQIVKPALGPLTCDDALVYQPSEFYLAVSAVANGAFTPREKAKEEHLNFLLEYLGQASSPLQIAPLSTVVQSATITEAQRQLLWTRLASFVENLQADDRSSSAALTEISDTRGEAFAEKLRQKSHECQNAPKLENYWQSATAKQLLEGGKKLRETLNVTPTVEWQRQLSDYLNLIADWTQDSAESDAVFYHEKCLVYTSLLDLVSGPQSDRILADYVDFVSNSDLYQQSPAEWFVEPHTVLTRAETDFARYPKVLEAYQRSGNPVLELVVALERAFGRNASSGAVSTR
jgi:hypothetical protein